MSGGADHSGGLLPRGRLPVGHVGARGPQSHATACASKPRNRQQRSGVLLMNRRGLVGPWGPRSWRTVAGKQRGAGGGAPWTSSVQPVRPGVAGRPRARRGRAWRCGVPAGVTANLCTSENHVSLAHLFVGSSDGAHSREGAADAGCPVGGPGHTRHPRDTRFAGGRVCMCVCAGVEMWFHELSLRQAAVLVGVALALAIGLVGTARPQ